MAIEIRSPGDDELRDALATLYSAFGLPPEAEIYDPENRPHPISRGTPVRSLFG
jgi:hypothetical protein